MCLLCAAGWLHAAAPKELLVYVGTYNRADDAGIHWLKMNLADGSLVKMGQLAKADAVRNPSFLAIHPGKRFLYSVNEVSDFNKASKDGAVSAFAIDPKTGGLKLLNQQSSKGAGPCHLVVDATGKNVLVANYGGGSVAALPIGEDGRLAAASSFVQHAGRSVTPRQAAPNAHSINISPDNRFAYAADLGLDKVLVYAFNAMDGKLAPAKSPSAATAPGAGPRHFAFHPSGKFAYVINEMTLTVTAFAADKTTGALKEFQTASTLPRAVQGGDSTAEVQVHPSGKFLYGSNRGHDSIAVFTIDQETGRLTPVQHQSTLGKTPRNFGLEPTGQFLVAANQSTGDLHSFRIDAATGKLTPTGHSIKVPQPVCVKFVPWPLE